MACPFKHWHKSVIFISLLLHAECGAPRGMRDKVIWITALQPSPLRMSLGQISSLLYMEMIITHFMSTNYWMTRLFPTNANSNKGTDYCVLLMVVTMMAMGYFVSVLLRMNAGSSL